MAVADIGKKVIGGKVETENGVNFINKQDDRVGNLCQ
jgi:hypothetical protein